MGKHSVEDEYEPFVVSVVNTTEGILPIVVAYHDLVGQRLVDLLSVLDRFDDMEWQTDRSDDADLQEAYLAFVRSPQDIINAAQSELETTNG